MSYNDYKKNLCFSMTKIFVCYASKVAKLSVGIHHGAEGKYVRDQDLQPWNCIGVRCSSSFSPQQLRKNLNS